MNRTKKKKKKKKKKHFTRDLILTRCMSVVAIHSDARFVYIYFALIYTN